MNSEAHASLKKLQPVAIGAIVIGAILYFVGFGANREAALQSYLFAWIFWTSITLGFYGLSLIHHMIKGNWAKPILRILEAGGGWVNLVMMAALFIPIAAFMGNLYPWMDPHYHWGPLDGFKRFWLTQPFFFFRFVIYFVIWGLTAGYMRKSSLAQDASGDFNETIKRSNVGAPSIVLFVLTVNFAFTDWVMSLDPKWFSTIYGIWFVVCQGLGGISMATIIATSLKDKKPFSDVITPVVTRDLGNVMLAFTMFWGYFSLSQFLIIYSGNLPEEISYFMVRMQATWLIIGTILVCGEFFAPFVFLLSGKAKREPGILRMVALLIIAMRILDQFWTVVPFFRMGANLPPASAYWVAIPAFLAVGGAWFLALTMMAAKAPLLPKHDVAMQEVLEHA